MSSSAILMSSSLSTPDNWK